MDSTIIFLVSIFLIVGIACLTGYYTQPIEKFTSCPDNPYRKKSILKSPTVEKKENKRVTFSEDEDINYHLTFPLVPRQVKYSGEVNNWKQFYKGKFNPGLVPRDGNFQGTTVRNYLDSIKYFHN